MLDFSRYDGDMRVLISVITVNQKYKNTTTSSNLNTNSSTYVFSEKKGGRTDVFDFALRQRGNDIFPTTSIDRRITSNCRPDVL